MKKFVSMIIMVAMVCSFTAAHAMESYDIHRIGYGYSSYWGFETYESYDEDEFKTSFDKSTLANIIAGYFNYNLFDELLDDDVIRCVISSEDHIGIVAWCIDDGFHIEVLFMTIV